MPITISDKLPGRLILEKENIFVMDKKRAIHQDIRPLRIALVNIMPTIIETETQIIRMLSNTPLQIELELVYMKSHISKHMPRNYFKTFYKSFDVIKKKKFDGLIITGAPVELLDFEQVDYWDELKQIMKWADNNVTSTIFLCWAAQAGLYYYYGIKKYKRDNKIFGVYPHHITDTTIPLLRGFDENFFVPHSRFTEIRKKDVEKIQNLNIIADSIDAGIHIILSQDKSKVFVFGHSEYDPLTLKYEFDRDKAKGINISIPENYFPGNDTTRSPIVRWRSSGFLFYSNWINYYVYQETPYNWIHTRN